MINQTRIEVSHLSNLCDFNDTNILVRGNITVAAVPITHVAFKNCSPFTKSMTKIDGTTAGNTEEEDMVIPMYNLIEYSLNYSDLTGSLRFYCKDEETNFGNDNAHDDNFKSFKYKAKLSGNTFAQLPPNNVSGILENATITVTLKFVRKF